MGFTSQNLKEELLVGIIKSPLISDQNLLSTQKKEHCHSLELLCMGFRFCGTKFSLSSQINKRKSQYFLVTSSFTPEQPHVITAFIESHSTRTEEDGHLCSASGGIEIVQTRQRALNPIFVCWGGAGGSHFKSMLGDMQLMGTAGTVQNGQKIASICSLQFVCFQAVLYFYHLSPIQGSQHFQTQKFGFYSKGV